MGLKEIVANLKQYNEYEIKAYQLQRNEAAECLQALEKQMAQKPYNVERARVTISGFCPGCHKENHYIVRPVMRSWCPYCGQKIDWNE